MAHSLALVISFAFCLAVIFGALTDVARFKIPNTVSYGIALLFIPHAALNWSVMPVLLHAGIGAFVLIAGIVFWQLKWIGGGDAKFLGAVSFWMGPGHILSFLLLMSLIAAIFVGLLKVLLNWNQYFQSGNVPQFLKQLLTNASERKIPYGLPIGISALVNFLLISSAPALR